jgi:hypothetical protein
MGELHELQAEREIMFSLQKVSRVFRAKFIQAQTSNFFFAFFKPRGTETFLLIAF